MMIKSTVQRFYESVNKQLEGAELSINFDEVILGALMVLERGIREH